MTTITGQVEALSANSLALTFTVLGTSYGIPLDNSSFSPAPATPLTNFSPGVVQGLVVLGAMTNGSEITFLINVGANETLLAEPPGSTTPVILPRAYNISQVRN